MAERIPNQPTNWYDFQVEDLAPSTGSVATVYHALFLQTEETQNLVGTGAPIPPGYIQFNPLPASTGAKHGLATAGGRARVRFRVRGINVNGQRGPWSPWKLTDNHDCLLLGSSAGHEHAKNLGKQREVWLGLAAVVAAAPRPAYAYEWDTHSGLVRNAITMMAR